MKKEDIIYKWDLNQEREIKATKYIQEAFRTKNELKRFFILQSHDNKEVLEQFREEYGEEKELEKILKSIVHETNRFYSGEQTIQLNTDNYVDHPGFRLGFFDVVNEKVELTDIGSNMLRTYNTFINGNKEARRLSKEYLETSKIFDYK
ncbi:MAG: hypothetical protein ACMXX9_02450 [Candidatus Woesearchaeota archaeon]